MSERAAFTTEYLDDTKHIQNLIGYFESLKKENRVFPHYLIDDEGTPRIISGFYFYNYEGDLKRQWVEWVGKMDIPSIRIVVIPENELRPITFWKLQGEVWPEIFGELVEA